MAVRREPVDPTVLRHALAAFIGADQFYKLVRQYRRARRLRYWQEEELNQFFDAHPDLRVGPDELAAALRVCELHGNELQPDTVEVVDGHVDYTGWYSRAKRDRFPNAASGPMYTEGGPSPGRVARVWFCPECRAAEAVWREEGDDHIMRHLRRRTTYREYALRWLADERAEVPERFRARFAEREAEVHAKLRPGDELWEYECGDRSAFADASGLAIVRDGVVVEHWVEWKS